MDSVCTANPPNYFMFFCRLSSISEECNQVFLGFFISNFPSISHNLDSLFPSVKMCLSHSQLLNKTHFSRISQLFSTYADLPCFPYLKYKLKNQGIYIPIIITNRYTKKEWKRTKFITFISEIKPKEWFEFEN